MLKLENIIFDDKLKVKNIEKETVEIPIGVLSILLDYYYTGTNSILSLKRK